MPIQNIFGSWGIPVQAQTGSTLTLTALDGGKIFTNRGAGAGVTFTLPVTSSVLKGWTVDFFTVAAQAITVASSPTDTLIVHADATADTIVTAATIGQHIKVICDGTGWLVISDPSAATTATAVTAVTLTT